MTIQVADELANANLVYATKGTAPDVVTLAELALCTDGSFTEVVDDAYLRFDLTANLEDPTAGDTLDVLAFDVGDATATHWEILHDDVWKIRGPLGEPKTGAFTVAFHALLRGTSP